MTSSESTTPLRTAEAAHPNGSSDSNGSTGSHGSDGPTWARVVTARNAVAAVFFLNGLGMATWFARIPAAKQALDLPAGQLGLVLLALSAGAVLAMLSAGAISARLGTATIVAGSALLLATGLVVTGIGAGILGSVVAVTLGLFAIGSGSGTCDVAMNVEAAYVERRLGRTVMPRFHAGWSIGTVVGAGLGALTSRTGVPIEVHLVLVAVVVAGGTAYAVRSFLTPAPGTLAPGDAEGPAGERFGVLAAWMEPRTLLLGLLLLTVAFTEGTANDWLALAFVDGYHVSEAGGAAVFGVFVAAMTTGRTVGTVALDRWGRVPVLITTMLLAAAGATLSVLAPNLALAVVGAALWGLGASLGFPVGMSAAADDESRAAARVSVVAVLGYTAFLAGPPVVGFLGDEAGVLKALLVVPLLLIPALALVPVARPPRAAAGAAVRS
jgi:MFS family permease